MPRRPFTTRLPAPYLKRITMIADRIDADQGYPFNLPWLGERFELEFTTPVTVIVGENGSGKSTLIEALAAMAGYDEAGGGKGYAPVDHSQAIDKSGATLGDAFRGSWLPKVTNGWFFRAESFYSVARYLDAAGSPSADFLSYSHGEGFLRFFSERCQRQGIYFLDEPESALSPRRQLDLLRLLHEIQTKASAQIIMATHSPILMALPGVRLLEISRFGIEETTYQNTRHFRLYRNFITGPEGFIDEALRGEW
ncbi:MAG: AAA family ATPase [Albidovulum sp.]